ncbi:MAG: condensation domain-containing protein, partial [Planctomycetota bacterium]
MTLNELIADLQQRGVTLRLSEQGNLSLSAPKGAIDARLADQVRTHKPALLALLSEGRVGAAGAAVMPRQAQQDVYRAFPNQERAFRTQALDAQLPSAFRLLGPVDLELLRRTLDRFVADHELLRGAFERIEGGQIQVRIRPHVPLVLPTHDVDGEHAAKQRLDVLRQTPLNPADGCCFRFEVVRLGPAEVILYAGFSPLVFDGWSFDIFWQVLTQGYAALAAGHAWPFSAPVRSYLDCASWLRQRLQDRRTELAAYWKEQLGETLPREIFRLNTIGRSAECVTVPFALSAGCFARLREVSAELGVSSQAILFAGLFAWAARIRGTVPAGDEDVVLGLAVEGRPHAMMERVVGSFANLLLVRERVTLEETGRALIKRVQARQLEAYERQELPLEELDVRSRPGATRACQIEFSFQQTTGRTDDMGPLRIVQVELQSGVSAADMTFWVKDWGDRIKGAIEFRRHILSESTVRRWIGGYGIYLEAILCSLDRPLGRLALLNEEGQAWVAAAQARAKLDQPVQDAWGHSVPLGVPGHIEGRDGLFVLHDDGTVERVVEKVSDALSASESRPPRDDVELALERSCRVLLGGEPISVTENLFNQGMNSLLSVKWARSLSSTHGLEITPGDVFAAPTIEGLARRINADAGPLREMVLPLSPPQADNPPLYCLLGIQIYDCLAQAAPELGPLVSLYSERETAGDGGAQLTVELARHYYEILQRHGARDR